jgi:toxin-antitoxin system PIN domain toxin
VDVLDANVLVGAFRADHPDHERLRSWLVEALAEERELGVAQWVELAFVRIVTHPRIFRNPSPIEEARSFLDALLGSGLVRPLPWSQGARRRWLEWCESLELVGDDVNDAQLAAAAAEGRCRLVSRDQGFARFPGLAWLDPAAPPPPRRRRRRPAGQGSG